MLAPLAESRLPVGPVNQRAGDGNALLFAAGELGGQGVGTRHETDALQKMIHAFATLGGGYIEQLQGQSDVFRRGQRRQQMEKLKDGADVFAAQAGEGISIELVNAQAVERNGAGVGPVDAAEAVE
jgi:hypothetical protein